MIRARIFRLAAPVLSIAGFLGTASPVSAAWDNVFQVCCNDCKPRMSYSQYVNANDCPTGNCPTNNCDTGCPPQKPQQRVEYQQRSYYEPITVMKPEKYLEPVEVKSKSYYWDPVTSYSYSSYYDSCSGQCQKIAVPRTSYKLKEQCNTSMKYVERMRMVPVQSQRLVTETTPVVTYYLPPTRSYSSPVSAESAAPRVDELRTAPPGIAPDTGATIPPTQLPTIPNSLQRSLPPATKPIPGGVNARTTSRPTSGSVRGEVVLNDQVTPRAGAKLVFVNVDDLSKREYVTADDFGNFDLTLSSGEWYMYIGTGTGRATFHKKITVNGESNRDFKVVSR